MTEGNSTNDKWALLTERLYFATMQNKISWSNGATENAIVTSIGNVVVTLLELGGGDFSISITNEVGDYVDSFRDADIPRLINGLRPFVAMGQIFHAAKRSISGADVVLDKLLEALPRSPDEEIPF